MLGTHADQVKRPGSRHLRPTRQTRLRQLLRKLLQSLLTLRPHLDRLFPVLGHVARLGETLVGGEDRVGGRDLERDGVVFQGDDGFGKDTDAGVRSCMPRTGQRFT